MKSEAVLTAEQRAAERRSRMQVGVIGLNDDHDAFDREYFAALSPGQKMAMVGKMFAEQWLLTGRNADQLRLRRDIARLQTRARGGISIEALIRRDRSAGVDRRDDQPRTAGVSQIVNRSETRRGNAGPKRSSADPRNDGRRPVTNDI